MRSTSDKNDKTQRSRRRGFLQLTPSSELPAELVTATGPREGHRAYFTRLAHPQSVDLRDPGQKWQRNVSGQAEQERALERLTEDAVASAASAGIDATWLHHVLLGHYRVWSFVEYGTFRALAAGQRESRSDPLSPALVFEGIDRLQHAQDIVIWLMELENNLPGFGDDGAKQRWASDPIYQPSRKLIEELHEPWDWGELAIATNLVIDPILTEVAVFELIQRNAAFHGDLVSRLIASTAARDRRWSSGWAQALVRLVTAEDLAPAADNRAIIQEWVARWTPLALDAAAALAPVYEFAPFKTSSFERALADAITGQQRLLESLGLKAPAPR